MAVVALGAALTWTGVAAHAQDDVAAPTTDDPALLPGFGQAVGQLLRVDPRASGLSFGVEIGAAKAGHQQYTSRSSSRVFDAGLIGLSLAGTGCTGADPAWPMDQQPQAITIDSRDEGAADGETLDEPPFERFVSADPQPASAAYVTSQSLGIPGIVEIGVGRSEAHSAMLEPGVREARATVDIADINLLGGLVVLEGLHWESVHRGGVADSHHGSFTIGSLTIAGVPVALPDTHAVFEAVNGVLAPLGVRIVEPVAHLSGKVEFVDPLAIRVEPNAGRDAITGGLLRALQPVRQALFDALLGASCEFAPYITIADLLIGSVTGAGTFSIELGGTEATTEPITPPAATGAIPGVRAVTPTSVLPTTPVRPAVAAPTTRPPTTTTAAPTELAGDRPVEPISSNDDPGRDLAAVVGLVTIALGIVLVEGDRRAMRRAVKEGSG